MDRGARLGTKAVSSNKIRVFQADKTYPKV